MDCGWYKVKAYIRPYKKYRVAGRRVRVKNWIKEGEYIYAVRPDTMTQFEQQFEETEGERYVLEKTLVGLDSLTPRQRHELQHAKDGILIIRAS